METGSREDNSSSNLVEICQVEVTISFSNQRQTSALYYVSKASIPGDCHGAVRRNIMLLQILVVAPISSEHNR